jgi:hypothetical protein
MQVDESVKENAVIDQKKKVRAEKQRARRRLKAEQKKLEERRTLDALAKDELASARRGVVLNHNLLPKNLKPQVDMTEKSDSAALFESVSGVPVQNSAIAKISGMTAKSAGHIKIMSSSSFVSASSASSSSSLSSLSGERSCRDCNLIKNLLVTMDGLVVSAPNTY